MPDFEALPPVVPHSRDRWLYLILLVAQVPRTYHFAYPFWGYRASRQTFNLIVVREFLLHGFDLTRPRVACLVSPSATQPSYFLGEFPLVHTLAAMVLRVLPFDDWCARLVIMPFSLAALYWI